MAQSMQSSTVRAGMWPSMHSHAQALALTQAQVGARQPKPKRSPFRCLIYLQGTKQKYKYFSIERPQAVTSQPCLAWNQFERCAEGSYHAGEWLQDPLQVLPFLGQLISSIQPFDLAFGGLTCRATKQHCLAKTWFPHTSLTLCRVGKLMSI